MSTNLDPKIIQFLKKRGIKIETLLEGYFKGIHRSPFFGHSLEFKDLRAYERGDDPKFIDWRIYGRTERFFVRKYEEETNIKVQIVLDISNSMSINGKSVVSKALASIMGFLSYYSRDSFGLFLFNEREVFYLPPSGSYRHLFTFLNSLDNFEEFGKTNFDAAMVDLDSRVKKRSLFVIISDFLYPLDSVKKFMRFFKSKGHELLVMPVISQRELFDIPKFTRLKDVETGVETEDIVIDASEYTNILKRHYLDLEITLKELKVKFFKFYSEQDLTSQIREFLEI